LAAKCLENIINLMFLWYILVSKTTPDILQELQTDLITNRQCNESLSQYGLATTRDMICALDTNKGVCNVSTYFVCFAHANSI